MKVSVIIESCDLCPHLSYRTSMRPFCAINNKDLKAPKFLYEIDKDCPMPKVE